MGRQTEFNQETADKICLEISTTSQSLKAICENEEFPCVSTVYKWLSTNKEFAEQYARAREGQADFLADEIIEIADTCREGEKTVEKENYVEVTKGDMVERSRLMINARKWKASKLAPKKYGDRLDIDHTSKGERIIPTINILPKSDI
jgi:hypothetical protein